MAPLVNSITHVRKTNTNSMETLSENSSGKNTAKIPLVTSITQILKPD